MSPDLDIANVTSDDEMKIGALADGLANTAVNDTNVEDHATGLNGVGNSVNTTTANSSADDNSSSEDGNNRDNDGNGNNRGNDYDWDYDTKINANTTTHNESDVDIKNSGNATNSNNDLDFTSNKSFSSIDTDVKTITDNDTKTTSHNEANNNGNTDSSSHSYSSSDDDFGTLKDLDNVGSVALAGHDLTYDIGDDFSFNLNVDHLLESSLNGEGNDTGFSLVQANNLADQDYSYGMSMDNSGAHNNLNSEGGDAYGAQGVGFDSKLTWDPDPGSASAGHDLTGSSVADASSILANSGYHQELVQGANMVSNASDIAITGGNDHHDINS